MNREQLQQNIEDSGKFSFARSGGPGGQNVNKVNTKVLLVVPLDALVSLNEAQKELLRKKLNSRLNTQGELFIQIQQERSQLMNKQLAVEILTNLILQSLKQPKPRRRTRPTRSSVEKRLGRKKNIGAKKKSRGRFSEME